MGVVGPKVDLSYDYDHLGDSAETVAQLAQGTHPFAKKLEEAKRPVVIVGSECLQVRISNIYVRVEPCRALECGEIWFNP